MKLKISKKYINFWIFLIVIISIFSYNTPSFLYSFQSIQMYKINFDNLSVNSSYDELFVTNYTANATAVSDVNSNITFLEINIPRSLLPNQKFHVDVNITNRNTTTQYMQISCYILCRDPMGLNDLILSLGSIDIITNKSFNETINCTSFNEEGLLNGRWGPLISYGINQIRISIYVNNETYISDVYFPIEINSDHRLYQISYGIIIGILIIGVAITAIWIHNDKRKTKLTPTSRSNDVQNDAHETKFKGNE